MSILYQQFHNYYSVATIEVEFVTPQLIINF